MRHAGEKYKPIQDPTGRIPEDEPVFLLRGQDNLAWILVRLWADLLSLLAPRSPKYESARRWSQIMHDWARKHGKIPH